MSAIAGSRYAQRVRGPLNLSRGFASASIASADRLHVHSMFIDECEAHDDTIVTEQVRAFRMPLSDACEFTPVAVSRKREQAEAHCVRVARDNGQNVRCRDHLRGVQYHPARRDDRVADIVPRSDGWNLVRTAVVDRRSRRGNGASSVHGGILGACVRKHEVKRKGCELAGVPHAESMRVPEWRAKRQKTD